MAKLPEPPCRFGVAPHFPRLYRYQVADPGLRLALNAYGRAVIGVALVIGRYAYCVKWGNATVLPSSRREEPRSWLTS